MQVLSQIYIYSNLGRKDYRTECCRNARCCGVAGIPCDLLHVSRPIRMNHDSEINAVRFVAISGYNLFYFVDLLSLYRNSEINQPRN